MNEENFIRKDLSHLFIFMASFLPGFPNKGFSSC